MVSRYFLVAAVLVFGTVPVWADYLQIWVDINNVNPFPPPKGNIPGVGQQGVGFGGQFGGPQGMPQKKGKGGQFGQPKGIPPQMPPIPPGNVPPGTNAQPALEPLWVMVYLDIKGKGKDEGVMIEMDHQFGKAVRIPKPSLGIPANVMELKPIQKGSLAASVKKLRDTKDKKNLVLAASKAWSYGLMKEFHDTIKELKDQDAKHPVVTAYLQVQKQLKEQPSDLDPADKAFFEQAKAEDYRPLVSDKGHYVLLSSSLGTNDAPIKRRLVRLEEAMEAYYYWFALQEKVAVPPMPKYRLLGIVVEDPVDFYKKNKSWGSLPMLGDGFTPRRENILVLSAKRLDETYAILEQKNKEWWQKIKANPEELVTGAVWQHPEAHAPGNVMPIAIIQTMTLVQKALEDEMERTTLSHEAARQLLTASGLLPRNVAAPEWIQEGLAAYFERPFGAVYGQGGLPSWSNLVAFKFHTLPPRSMGKGKDILVNVLSDGFFHTARAASMDLEEARDRWPERVRDDWERARSTSWALVYYLAKEQKMDLLLNYANEIGQMPRDLELSRPALEGCFARAFALGDPKDALKMDPTRLQVFADHWMEFMKGVNLELAQVQDESLKERKENASGVPTKNAGPSIPKKGNNPPPPPPPR